MEDIALSRAFPPFPWERDAASPAPPRPVLSPPALLGQGGDDNRHTARRPVSERTLLVVMRHISTALHCLHSRGIAHLDVKPANMLMKVAARADDVTVFKLADLGHSRPVDGPSVDAEGDSRYVCQRLLEGTSPSLESADIFSLGASLVELAVGEQLPKGGEDYAALRRGNGLPPIDGVSDMVRSMLEAMIHPDPTERCVRARHGDATLAAFGDTHVCLLQQADCVANPLPSPCCGG